MKARKVSARRGQRLGSQAVGSVAASAWYNEQKANHHEDLHTPHRPTLSSRKASRFAKTSEPQTQAPAEPGVLPSDPGHRPGVHTESIAVSLGPPDSTEVRRRSHGIEVAGG